MNFETTAGGLDPKHILNVRRLPGKLTDDQTAALLGFASHDIPVLMKAKLLKPLGKPDPRTIKWFASCEVELLRNNSKWLDLAIKAVNAHWKSKNLKKQGAPSANESVIAEGSAHLFNPNTNQCVYCGKSAEDDTIENTPCPKRGK